MTRIMRTTWALLIAMSACSSGAALPVQPGLGDFDKTGLEGTVRRGPTQPVCRAGEPCDAPLQAEFTLQQAERVVARFASDSQGHFLVYVQPGTYLVVPDEPIGIGPEAVEITVEGGGLTRVDLTFDTGIR
jgi:hypothetical protein